jgi:hypothetical protein
MNSTFWKESEKSSEFAEVPNMEKEGTKKGPMIPRSFKSFLSRNNGMETEPASLADITEVSPAQEEERESVPAKDETSQTANTSISSSTMQSMNNEQERGEKFVFGLEHDETGSLTEEKLSIIEADDAMEVSVTSRKTAKSKPSESQKSDDSVCASKEAKNDVSNPAGSVSSRKSKAASVRQSDKSVASGGNFSHRSRASISSRKSKKSISKDAANGKLDKVETPRFLETTKRNQTNDAASMRSKSSISSKMSRKSTSQSAWSKPMKKELDVSVCRSEKVNYEIDIQMAKSEPMPLIHHREERKVSFESQTTKVVHNNNHNLNNNQVLDEPPQPQPQFSRSERSDLPRVPSSIRGDAIAFAATPSQITWTSIDSQNAADETEDGIETAVFVPNAVPDSSMVDVANGKESPNDGERKTAIDSEQEEEPVNLEHANADSLLIHEAVTAVTELKVQATKKVHEKYTEIVHRFCGFCFR